MKTTTTVASEALYQRYKWVHVQSGYYGPVMHKVPFGRIISEAFGCEKCNARITTANNLRLHAIPLPPLDIVAARFRAAHPRLEFHPVSHGSIADHIGVVPGV